MASNEDYKFLRRKIASAACSPEELLSLKKIFAKEVNSKRCLERIGNLSELIDVLEKRTFLHQENIAAFILVERQLNRKDLGSLIKEYQRQRSTTTTTQYEAILPAVSQDMYTRIYDLLCMEIGSNWTSFSRRLGISEAHIDQLHSVPMKERVMQVLLYHQRKCEPNRLRTTLCNALQEERRNDLKLEVQRIFDMYNR